MDTQFYAEVLRLHCEHLRTLIDTVITELTTIEHSLAPEGNPSSITTATHLKGLEKQSEHLAAETLRFQSFLHSLGPPRMDASDTDGESHQSSPPPLDTPKTSRCKIVCTLDGKEPAVILYDRYADQEIRTFPNERHAIRVHEYLCRRARGMRWDAEPPIYAIAPADE
jgi:hypothetical protein